MQQNEAPTLAYECSDPAPTGGVPASEQRGPQSIPDDASDRGERVTENSPAPTVAQRGNRTRKPRKPSEQQTKAASLSLVMPLSDVADAVDVHTSAVYRWAKAAWWEPARRAAAAADVALAAGLRVRGKAAAMLTLTAAAEAGNVDAARALEPYVRDTAAEKREAAYAERDRAWLAALAQHAPADVAIRIRAAVVGDDESRLATLSTAELRVEAGL